MFKKIAALVGLIVSGILVASPLVNLNVRVKTDDLEANQTFITAYDQKATMLENKTSDKGIEVSVTPKKMTELPSGSENVIKDLSKAIKIEVTITEIKNGTRKLLESSEIITSLGEKATVTRKVKGHDPIMLEVRSKEVAEADKVDAAKTVQEK